MAGQVLRTIPVKEARAKIDVGIDPDFQGQRDLSADAQRDALIVIDIEKPFGRWREVCQSADNGALSFYNLIGIGEVEMEMTRQFRRMNYRLPSADCYVLNTQRERNVGIPKDAVVGEVSCKRPEVGEVYSPTA